jgi:tRNA (guanosine-2'-O-)-methyltransferase
MDSTWISVGDRQYQAHQIIDALGPLLKEDRIIRLKNILSQRLTSVILGIEDLHHEHNGSACLRTAEGLGLHRVMAAEVRNPYPLGIGKGANKKRAQLKSQGKVLETISKAAHRWIQLDRYSSGIDLVQTAQSQGYQVYGAGPRGNLTLTDLPIDQPLMVLFGNEGNGLQDETMDACNGIFRIPMYGFTESFNISVSVGMVLEQVCNRVRQRLIQEGKKGDLSTVEQECLLAEWCMREFKKAPEIIHHILESTVL